MPLILLELKCAMTGITELKPSEPESFRWYLKLKCTNCGEAPDHWQYVTLNEILEVPGSRGQAHLVEKCKLCHRINTLSIQPDYLGTYLLDSNEKWQRIVGLDCRGIEPTEFDPRNGWQAVGPETNEIFSDIDLSEKMWADYDEKANEAVEIANVEFRFTPCKQKK